MNWWQSTKMFDFPGNGQMRVSSQRVIQLVHTKPKVSHGSIDLFFCWKKNSPVDSKKWPVDIDHAKIDDVPTLRLWKSILVALKLLKFPLQNFISNIFIVSKYANVEVCLWCDPWMIMMVYPPRFYKVAKFKLFILFNTVCDATKYIYRFWHYI